MKKIFMVSFAFITLAITFGIFQMTSCKKADAQTNCPPATYPVAGVWVGTYTTIQISHAPAHINFIILPDGVFMRRAKVIGNATEFALTRGRWTLTGSTFQFRDTSILYSGGTISTVGTATFNNNGTLTNASWQDVSGQTYTGEYQNFNRVN